MHTRCFVVDDEPLAIDLMRSYIQKVESLEIVGCSTDAIEAFEMMHKVHVDLLFVDIQMPQLTGIEFVKSLIRPPVIIITTAYREYAYEGFEMDVFDYLLKPITFDRFLRTINRYYERYPLPDLISESENEAYIVVKEGHVMKKVKLEEILYLEAQGEYIKFFLDDKIIIAPGPMRQYEMKLNSTLFIRIHKSYLVRLSKVDSFTTSSVKLGKTVLPVGRKYKSSVLSYFDLNS